MGSGAKLLLDAVPLSAGAGAEPVSPRTAARTIQRDYLLSFLLGTLTAGLLLATGNAVATLLGRLP